MKVGAAVEEFTPEAAGRDAGAGGDELELAQGEAAVVRGFGLGEVVLAEEVERLGARPLRGGSLRIVGG